MQRIVTVAATWGLVVWVAPAAASDYSVAPPPRPPAGAARAAATSPQQIPLQALIYFGGRPACHIDSPRGLVRLWWSENRRASGRLDDSDARCRTRPAAVTALAPALDLVALRERALGLPRPPSDLGARTFGSSGSLIDGGSAAVDVYLVGHQTAGSGVTPCTAGLIDGRPRGYAYVMLGASPRPVTAGSAFSLVQAFAHELVHTSQCGLVARDGSALLREAGTWVVEGTAESVSTAALRGRIADGLDRGELTASLAKLQYASGRPERILPARWNRSPVDLAPYSAWGFWYGIQGGASARRITALYRAILGAPSREHHRQNLGVIYRRFGVRRIQAALRAFAVAARFGGPLADIDIPGRYRDFTEADPAAAIAAAPTRTARQVLLPRAYRYLRATWPAGATRLHVHIRATPASDGARVAAAVAVALPDGTRVAPGAGGAVFDVDLTRVVAPPFGPLAVTVVMANGAVRPLGLVVTATSS